jgi:hypothetical protein
MVSVERPSRDTIPLNMTSVLILTMDIKRVWAMEPTRDNIKELCIYIPLRHQLMQEANRDMTKF